MIYVHEETNYTKVRQSNDQFYLKQKHTIFTMTWKGTHSLVVWSYHWTRTETKNKNILMGSGKDRTTAWFSGSVSSLPSPHTAIDQSSQSLPEGKFLITVTNLTIILASITKSTMTNQNHLFNASWFNH